jgi:hypothetical protein
MHHISSSAAVLSARSVVLVAGMAILFSGNHARAQVSLAASFVDTDSDGVVDRSEFVLQVNAHIDKIIRRNADGFQIVDPAGLEEDILAYFSSLSGDFDGDGVVTPSDLVAIVSNPGPVSAMMPGPMQGDVNQDGVADIADMVEVASAMGSPVVFEHELAWALFAQIVIEGADLGYDPTLVQIFAPDGAGRGGDPHRGPNDHTQVISATWPPPPGQFPPTDWNWPSDHLGTVSSTWVFDPGDPHTDPSAWPANHHQTVSSTWDGSAQTYWPPNHDIARSNMWDDDGQHQSLTSRQWPAGHARQPSILGQDSTVHVTVISSAGDHDLNTSEAAGWPPNHILALSRTWTPDHDRQTSQEWPPNHLMTISTSWTDPGSAWPANHYEVVSLTWSQPGDHGTRISVLFHPANPFRLPALWLSAVSDTDLIAEIDLR